MTELNLYELFSARIQRPSPDSTHHQLLERFCREIRKDDPHASDEELFEKWAEKARLLFTIPELPPDEHEGED